MAYATVVSRVLRLHVVYRSCDYALKRRREKKPGTA